MIKKRAMTAGDRAALQGFITAQSPQTRELWGVLVVSLTLDPAIFAGAALLVLGGIASLAGLPIRDGGWTENPVTWFGAIAVAVGIWLATSWSGLNWWKRARRSRQARLADLHADLQNGVVVEETLTVTGIKRLREPEHGMVRVFLRMSQGKVFVLYDETGALAPHEAFHLVTFPVSTRRSWLFSGAPLPLPPVQEIQAPPERWPEDESWCRLPWEKIDGQFGARV